MDITLKYSTTRREIADWYWRTWKRSLWKYHVVVFLIILFFISSLDGHWPIEDYRFVLYGFLIAIGVLSFLIFFPQIMYKPQTRTLTVNEDGIRTVIGSRSGEVKWKEIANIETTSEHIAIMRRTGNSFLIPRRAFQSDNNRDSFVTTIKKWWQKSA